MKKILNVYKPAGKTPLEIINKLKKENLEYENVSVTYAGRLDPLAEGVLILLAGDEVHKKNEYLDLDKKYKAEILLGFETDTFDILGFPNYRGSTSVVGRGGVRKLKGDFVFELPAYSSFKVKGKPLFQWAREGKIDEIEIPQRKTKIYDIDLLDEYEISSQDLLDFVVDKINLVRGDFRQEETKKQWKRLLKNDMFKVVKINVHCSSGTYVRSIADKLGGILLSLKRTKVGDFDFRDSIRI